MYWESGPKKKQKKTLGSLLWTKKNLLTWTLQGSVRNEKQKKSTYISKISEMKLVCNWTWYFGFSEHMILFILNRHQYTKNIRENPYPNSLPLNNNDNQMKYSV